MMFIYFELNSNSNSNISAALFLCKDIINIQYVLMYYPIRPLHTTLPCRAHMCHLAGPVASPRSVRPSSLFPR